MVGALPDLGAERAVELAGARSLAMAPGTGAVWAATARGAELVPIDGRGGAGPLARVRTAGRVRLAVSPGGRSLALVGRVALPRATAGVWDLRGGGRVWTATVYAATCADWVDGAVLAVGGRDLRLFGHDGSVLPAGPVPRGLRITALAAWTRGVVSAGEGPVATVWELDTVRPAATIPVPAGAGRALAVGGPTLAAGTLAAGEAVALVDLRRGTVDHVLAGVACAAFAGPWLVVSGREGTAVFRWQPDG